MNSIITTLRACALALLLNPTGASAQIPANPHAPAAPVTDSAASAKGDFDTTGFAFEIADGPFQPDMKSFARLYRCPEWFRDAKFGIYMICLGIPNEPSQIVSLAKTDKPVAAVELLGSNEKLSWKQEPGGLTIQPAKAWPAGHAVVFKITFEK